MIIFVFCRSNKKWVGGKWQSCPLFFNLSHWGEGGAGDNQWHLWTEEPEVQTPGPCGSVVSPVWCWCWIWWIAHEEAGKSKYFLNNNLYFQSLFSNGFMIFNWHWLSFDFVPQTRIIYSPHQHHTTDHLTAGIVCLFVCFSFSIHVNSIYFTI